MRFGASTSSGFFVAACFLAFRAQASDIDLDAWPLEYAADEYEAEVRGGRVRPADETVGFAQTIEVADHSRQLATVSDVLSRSVGVRVRRLGGFGSHASVSVRGSTSAQVPIFLDGVQLNAGGFHSVDLGDLSLDSLEALDVYRSGVPVLLGTGGIGGAISLRSRACASPFTEVSASYGSWHSGRFMVMSGAPVATAHALVLFSSTASRGDFWYLNQNGTLHNPDDDTIMRRSNNAHQAHTVLVRVEGPMGRFRWRVINDFYIKDQGMPGIGNIPTQDASLFTLRDAVTLQLQGPKRRGLQETIAMNYLGIRDRFNDESNEIGIGHQILESRVDTLGLMGTLEKNWNRAHTSHLRLESRFEGFSFADRLRNLSSDLKWRMISQLGLSHDWTPVSSLLFTPAFRAVWHHARYDGGDGPIGVGTLPPGERDLLYGSPSIGVRYAISERLILRTNAGHYVRAPDIAELFGDRGSVVGNPLLAPETGTSADAGFSVAAESDRTLRMRLDASVFGSLVQNLIAYVQNSQNTLRPENIDNARIVGAEMTLRLQFDPFLSFDGNYTFLHGENRSSKPYHTGRKLPGRPAHEAWARIQLFRPFSVLDSTLWFDGDFAGSNYLDPANLKPEPVSRLLFGAGLRLSHVRSGLSVTVEARNLLDRIAVQRDGRLHPLQDYDGFPLPGRTIFCTLNWRSGQ